ncbi:MAG: tetratricopeptide repeat protein, partial [Actinomycetota bacterium]
TDLKKGEKVGAVKRRPRRGIEALAISIKIGDRFGQAWSLQGLAEINRLQGRYDEADEQHRRAETLFCQLGTAADTAAAEATAELAEW